MACSNKSLVILVAPLLLLALLATPAAAGRAGGFQLQQEAGGEHCGPTVGPCNGNQCSATCAVLGINGDGQCSVVGGVDTCCCIPKPPSTSVGVQSTIVDPSLA